jgi:hypothetical protein
MENGSVPIPYPLRRRIDETCFTVNNVNLVSYVVSRRGKRNIVSRQM